MAGAKSSTQAQAVPLMPKATAVWLIDNTGLSFDQIAVFCGLHPLEVKGIANGDVADGIKGIDPVINGQLTREEIERCQSDPATYLELAKPKVDLPETKPQGGRGSRYTPLSKRQERPDAIAWLIRNHPELNDAEIGRLVGTTKPTIQSVRERTHWNMSQISPVDPVALGFCKQVDLDNVVARATRRAERKRKAEEREARKLKAAEETTAIGGEESAEPSAPASDNPFSSLSDISESDISESDISSTSETQDEQKPEDDMRPSDMRPEDVFKS